MAQWLRACTALSKDPTLTASTQAKMLTTAYNFGSRGSDSLFWSLQELHLYAHANTDTYSYTQLKKIIKYFLKSNLLG